MGISMPVFSMVAVSRYAGILWYGNYAMVYNITASWKWKFNLA